MKTILDEQIGQLIKKQVDLAEWVKLPAETRAERLQILLQEMKAQYGIEAELCFRMPVGFEMANGLYDPIKKISYLNLEMPGVGPVEQLLILLHEFRHAMQNSRQDLFSRDLVKGLRYVIQFDGTCYRQHEGKMQQVKLEGEQAYYTELYLAQPYERDANEFARDCLLAACNSDAFCEQIQDFFSMWSPPFVRFSEEEAAEYLQCTYDKIDAALDCE